MSFGAVNNVNRRLNIILAALPNFRRFLGMKGLPGDPFVLSSLGPMDPLFLTDLMISADGQMQVLISRHRNFPIWSMGTKDMPVLVKNSKILSYLSSKVQK